MKRSDMVDEMFKTFYTCVNSLGYDYKKALDRVLEMQEEKGMKPPGYVYDPECIGSYVEDEWEQE